jgi:hypothetical protein
MLVLMRPPADVGKWLVMKAPAGHPAPLPPYRRPNGENAIEARS